MLQTIIPPPIFSKFEHEITVGGGSGDSGGSFATLMGMLFFTISILLLLYY